VRKKRQSQIAQVLAQDGCRAGTYSQHINRSVAGVLRIIGHDMHNMQREGMGVGLTWLS